MARADDEQLAQAAREADAVLAQLGLSEREKQFAREQADALMKTWLAEGGPLLAEVRRRRLRPRVVPGVLAYALAAAANLYRYAMDRYPSRGA